MEREGVQEEPEPGHPALGTISVSVRRGACESSYEQDLLEPCGGTVFRARFPRAERSSISTLAARHPLAAVGKTAQAGCPR